MTVKELREQLEGIPDDELIVVGEELVDLEAVACNPFTNYCVVLNPADHLKDRINEDDYFVDGDPANNLVAREDR